MLMRYAWHFQTSNTHGREAYLGGERLIRVIATQLLNTGYEQDLSLSLFLSRLLYISLHLSFSRSLALSLSLSLVRAPSLSLSGTDQEAAAAQARLVAHVNLEGHDLRQQQRAARLSSVE